METYQFVKQIGQGSYGDVWLVKCSKTRKKYVLKRIDLHCASKREQRAAHLEAKLLSTLKHPNIVTYLDSFHDSKGNLFIVMGYCESGDLYTYIRNQNSIHFEEKQVIHWFVQICMALKYLHDRNILHRDLKTQNIFLTKNKLIKVGDLGIARELNTTQEMATTLIGTPYYMSPEIFAGKPYNQKSDIWALGCCIYEIATLKHAFIAQDIHTLLHKVMKGKLSMIPEIYSEELFTIISSMLNHDPEKRPCVTELLLNDYVRKYILLFLEDKAERSTSSNAIIAKDDASSVTSQRSKSSCSLPFLPNDNLKRVDKNCGTDVEAMDKAIITVPDINGNGDGNDNSQQRPIISKDNGKPDEYNETSSVTENSCPSKSTPVKERINIKTINHRKSCKENVNHKNDIVHSSISPVASSVRPVKIDVCLNREKRKGENCFQILNNLTFTIKNARLKNWEYAKNGTVQIKNTSPKYFCGISPPKSAEELYSHSKIASKIAERRTVSSANCDVKSVSYECQTNMFVLPQIRNEENKKQFISKDLEEISLPSLKNGEFLSFGGNNTMEQHFSKDSQDNNIDKMLVQKVMECSKTKNGQSNFAAHEYRNEETQENNAI